MEGLLVNKKVWISLISILVLISVGVMMLPTILRWLGLHPHFQQKEYDLRGKKALIITTSHDTLGDDGTATGVYASEMTIPYYEFLDAGMTVDLASIQGGEVPIEPMSLKWPLATPADRRFLQDQTYLEQVKNSLSIEEIDFLDYDLIFMAGGWGAAYDLGQSEILGQKISVAYAQDKIIGSVCHGALGFLQAVKPSGEPLVKGKRMTAVTDKQVKELKITATPLHPEAELRKLGANFESKTAFRDFFANHVVVDGHIVTGQNQNSGGPTAQSMLQLLSEQQ